MVGDVGAVVEDVAVHVPHVVDPGELEGRFHQRCQPCEGVAHAAEENESVAVLGHDSRRIGAHPRVVVEETLVWAGADLLEEVEGVAHEVLLDRFVRFRIGRRRSKFRALDGHFAQARGAALFA